MAEACWNEPSVTAMHPIGGSSIGWDRVEDSFAQVAKLSSGCEAKIRDQRIVAGSDVAYELGFVDGKVTLAGTPP